MIEKALFYIFLIYAVFGTFLVVFVATILIKDHNIRSQLNKRGWYKLNRKTKVVGKIEKIK